MNRRLPALALAAAWAAAPSPALAHAGEPPLPHDLWSSWNTEPLLVLGLVIPGWLYARGIAELWSRAGRGRGVGKWQVASFAAGLAVLAIALISPLDAMSSALFSAHMAQHLLLVLVAPPLLILGVPLVPGLWALPRSWRLALARWSSRPMPRAIGRVLTIPVAVLALHVLTLWMWHAPILYEGALARESIHRLEHVSLFGPALLFWWVVIQPHGRRRLGYGPGVIVVVVAALQGTLLGALITFSGTPWYDAYRETAPAWGLSPLDDQQLAGAIMWAPMGIVYLAAALALLIAQLQLGDRRSPWPSTGD